MNETGSSEGGVDRDVVVIGAGLAGLSAAGQLQAAGLSVIVLDKGRSAGGRLATRRLGNGRADHGAQFFTVRTQAFAEMVAEWQKAGLVQVWSRGWSDGSLSEAPEDGHPRYICLDGMNSLAQRLARGLDVRADARATAVSQVGDGWVVEVGEDAAWRARAVLLTPPVPQSLALVDMGRTTLHPRDRKALERIRYAPCVTGLFVVEGGGVMLPEPGAIQRPRATISWIADNRRKGISPDALVVTVQAAPAFSRKMWSMPDEEALTAVRAGLMPHMGPDARIVDEQLKRWRYADPEVLHPTRYLLATDLPPLAFAGDAFAGPRVEGAVLSGVAAGEALLDHVS
jgi:hypothetical protein